MKIKKELENFQRNNLKDKIEITRGAGGRPAGDWALAPGPRGAEGRRGAGGGGRPALYKIVHKNNLCDLCYLIFHNYCVYLMVFCFDLLVMVTLLELILSSGSCKKL